MARPTMRRLSPLALALPISLVFALGTAVPASAQDAPSATLTLLSQTSWNCPKAVDPRRPAASGLTCPTGRELVIRFRAQNTGTTPLDQLAIGVSLYSRILSRSAYEASLTTDPSLILMSDTLVREGAIQPGGTRDFEVSMVLDTGLDPVHSGVYPVKVDLRSGDTSVAAIRTPAIFLVREPEIPLTLSWTFVLSHPITFAPDGTFTDPSLETSLAPGGRLSGQIRALRDLAADPTAPPVDVAISPVLLTQLGRMRGGYSVVNEDGTTRDVSPGQGGSELATRAMNDLRAVAAAPGVEVTTLPYSAPEIPSLYGGGLGRDVRIQLERGRAVASALIQAEPPEQILRPPGAALDEETLRGLAGLGVDTLIVGPTTVELPPQPLGFAGPATTALGDGAITAIVPELSTDAVMTSVAQADPVRAAQVVLGELTTIWQEAPGETRSVALVLGEDAPLPGPFFPPLVRDVAGAPWLTLATAGAFVEDFPSTETLALANPSFRPFPPAYVVALKQARRRLQTLRSMLPDTSIEPERLETMLLLAEARQFLTSTEDGLAFIASVRNSVKEAVDGLSLDTVSTVALSSDSGGIPVTVSNAGQRSLSVLIQLVAPQLRNAPSERVQLGPGQSETVRLEAQLRSTGRFPVQVRMTAPDGRGRPIEVNRLIVRSTAYNRIALLITIGAALMLVAVWARRFLPRRTT
jgi:Family of unknown function (DUF6049)